MCTAVTYKRKNFYFGRTLDFEFLYPCEVTFTPRKFPFDFCFAGEMKSHFAILGMAYVADDYPLYFDGVNEYGLCMAGLNFVGNAEYKEPLQGKENIASFEFIPYILGKCKDTKEAKMRLRNINITNTAFREDLPPSGLHWIIADRNEAVVVESVSSGLKVYENTIGVLTNNPPFEYHIKNLRKYRHLSPNQREDKSESKDYCEFSRGTGALGLPGDFTSQSRFVRAVFLRDNSHNADTEQGEMNQVFHILSGVSVPEGCCVTEKGEFDKTIYASCIDADKGVYYYKPYESQGVFSVFMQKENLNEKSLRRYPFRKDAPVIKLN